MTYVTPASIAYIATQVTIVFPSQRTFADSHVFMAGPICPDFLTYLF